MLEPAALHRLTAPFADPSVGGVAGDYYYEPDDAEAEGERAYWNIDRVWKLLESRAGSVTSATGQLYAIRRDCFDPVPDGVTDDFFVSTGAIDAGRRLWFEPTAVASGPVAATIEAEFGRKVRVIGRGFASVWARRRLLDPRVSGAYAIQLLSHKVLRRLVGAPLILLALSAPLLWSLHPLYRVATLAQLLLHLLALGGWLLRHRQPGRLPFLALPLFFDMASLAGLLAFADFARGRQRRAWEPQRAEPRGAKGVPAASVERRA
jgi:hypothetical protein